MSTILCRQEYAQRIQTLISSYRWIKPNHTLDPAPGHLQLVSQLLCDFDRILGDTLADDDARVEFLCIRGQDWTAPVGIWADFSPTVSRGRQQALDAALERITSQSRRVCRACGEPSMREDGHCSLHMRTDFMFADDQPTEDAVTPPEAGVPPASVLARLTAGAAADDDVAPAPCEEVGTAPEVVDLRPVMQLYDPVALDTLAEDSKGRDRDTRERIKLLVTAMQRIGARRPFAVLPPDWNARLDQLDAEFPNFSQFIGAMRAQFMLQSLGNGVISLPPALLNGPAGIGKTEMVSRLATLLGLPPPLVIDISIAQNSAVLTGSDAHWSNAREGELFRLLALGAVANPIVILDEIEKSSDAGTHRVSPVAALHGLLEKRSAEKFKDLALRTLEIDASHVIWLATSNDKDKLELPIQSRLTIFKIEPPSRAQAMQIAKNVYRSMLTAEPWGAAFTPDLSEQVTTDLAQSPPREIKRVIRLACGRAAGDGRDQLRVDDVKAFLNPRSYGRSRIGFLGDQA